MGSAEVFSSGFECCLITLGVIIDRSATAAEQRLRRRENDVGSH